MDRVVGAAWLNATDLVPPVSQPGGYWPEQLTWKRRSGKAKGWLIAMTKKVPSEGPAVERRRARRFPVDWDVVVKGKDGLGSIVDEAGSLMDLSSRGALLFLPRQLRVGMRLELWIRVPSEPERWMTYGAEIVRLDQDRRGVGTATKFLAARPKLHSTPQKSSAAELAILQLRTAEDSGKS